MLLQTNSYVVPKDRRAEHARLLRRFRQTLARLGCDHFETYEQVGQNWSTGENSGRFVQIMRFRDRRHQLAVQAAERNDPLAQQLIAEFCELINFPYQQQHGLFAVGFYTSALPVAPARPATAPDAEESADDAEIAAAAAAASAAAETAPPDQQTYVAQASAPAEFSGEPVTPEDAHTAESLEEEPEAPQGREVPVADAVPEETETVDQPASEPTEFQEEMEALGEQLEKNQVDEHHVQEQIPAGDESEEALEEQPADALPDVSLENEHPAVEEEHPVGGNGSRVDRAPAAESGRFGNGEAVHKDEPHEAASHGAFDTFLEENFGSEASTGDSAGEDHPLPGGSGIGQVLDAGLLDDDDLDVALPADLIEDDDLEPHARDAEHPGGLGEGREPRRA